MVQYGYRRNVDESHADPKTNGLSEKGLPEGVAEGGHEDAVYGGGRQ